VFGFWVLVFWVWGLPPPPPPPNPKSPIPNPQSPIEDISNFSIYIYKYNYIIYILMSKANKQEIKISELSEEEKKRLFKSYKTLNKMMEDRGYDNIAEKDLEFKSSENEPNKNNEEKKTFEYKNWLQKVQGTNQINGIFDKKDELSKKVYFQYITSNVINTEQVKDFFKIMKIRNFVSGIMIILGKLSSQAKNKIEEINKEIQLEIFTVNELIVNITEHELVPKHILLTQDEKNELMKRYKIQKNQLPKILVSDPVARYLGLRRGDVVKIIRNSETAGKYITYRMAF